MQTFFKDLKVVELASVLAGPAVGMFFAEFGAEVIKIENKTTGGDVTRGWKLPSENAPLAASGGEKTPSSSAYFHSVNYHKTHYFLDLQDITDKEKTLEILRGCDIVISNFRKSSAVKMGMDYDSIAAINPTVVYAQLYGFDEEDETPAFDVVLQAEAGFMFMTGEKGRGAVKMPVALIDIMAAHQLKEGILMALLARERTGKGAFVSTTLYEAAIASLANQATNWLMAGQIPQRIGAEHPNIAPYGDVFVTSDSKEIVLACGTEKQWQTLCKVLNINDLAHDRRFVTNAFRVKNRAKLVKILRGYILAYERDTLLDTLQKANVPAGAIRNMQEVFENPMAQKMVLEEAMPEGGVTKRVKTVAVRLKF
jgi:crotonobetainyl-CoA:carnitine CoA-transferase CaiB-like acyl-CoA transferase